MVWITNQTLDASMTSKERYRVSALDSRIKHYSLYNQPQITAYADLISWYPKIMHP